jgi:regulator of sigma E protease
MDLLANMPTGVAAIFWGVLTFSILVVLHEGGHFLAARAFGVKVHEFMLGLPGPALKWRSKKSGVIYGITAVPLGGYVRIAGMEPGVEDALLAKALGTLVDRGQIGTGDLAAALEVQDDRASSLMTTLEDYVAAEQMEDRPEDRALVTRLERESDEEMLARVRASVYRGQPTWKRVTILAMGVLVNLISAIVILTVALSLLGVPTATLTLEAVTMGSPAHRAGVHPGDTITALDGRTITRWDQVLEIVATKKPGDTIALSVKRGGEARSFSIVLARKPDGHAQLGIKIASEDIRMPPTAAFRESLNITGQVFVAIGRFFQPKTFSSSLGNARSVVGISYEVADAAKAGPLQYSLLVALLSLSLGVMNILPIPPLDGGKVAVELVEALLRRPIPKKVSYALSGIGAVLLFSLIFYLMYADVMRYIVQGS